MKIKCYFLAILCFLLSWQARANVTGSQVTANRFQQIFTTAAYSAALGGAIGTAVLAFTPNPADNLRFIAVGASIGFMSGILLGGYLAFVPSYKKKSSAAMSYRGPDYGSSLGQQIRSDVLTLEASFGDGQGEGVTEWALHFPVVKF